MMRKSTRRSFETTPASAFTLMEVLVALVIFLGMAVVFASSYLGVLNNYEIIGRANLSTEDLSFARSQLLAEPDRKLVEEGAEFESVNGRRVRWSATIASTSLNDLFTVTFVCEISDPAKPEPEKVTQTFTLLRPTWSDPAERGELFENAKVRILELQGKNP
jgi:general secretion pathway protein I